MYVKVQFKSRFGDTYGGREYTYRCNYDAIVGDIVKVPAGDGTGIARVSEINVPLTDIDTYTQSRIKDVIGPAEYKETLFEMQEKQEGEQEETTAVTYTGSYTTGGEAIISIEQMPKFKNFISSLVPDIEARTKDALMLAVTPETEKAVKDVRAQLRKEQKDFHDRVMAVINKASDPIKAVDEERKRIEGIYKDADDKLRDKLDTVNSGIVNEKREGLRKFYEEERWRLHLDKEELADFDKWPENVIRSTTDNEYQKRITAYLDILAKDLETIAGLPDGEEVMVEYKLLRAANQPSALAIAQKTVAERKRRVEEERTRKEALAAERAEREAREKAAREKVEAALAKAEPLAPPVEAPAPKKKAPDPNSIVKVFRFEVRNAKYSQLKFITDYLKQEGIEYGKC